MADEELWKRRFQMFVLVRLIGMATFALGVVIAYSDLLRPGGWPMVGLIVAIIGAADALFAPRMLKKVWEQQDRAQK
jgi:hypothetical protein